MIAVICGATGLVGSHLIHKLLDDSRIKEVVSVSRSSLRITSSKLKEVICSDFKDLSIKAHELKGDIYFCCLGTTIKTAGSQEKFRAVDYNAVLEFGKIAKSHDAKSFVVISAEGANARSKIFYSRVKGEVEEALKNLNLNHLVIMRPSLLMGERKEFRLGEKIAINVMNGVGKYLPDGIRKRAMTSVDVLASRMLEEAIQSTRPVSVIGAIQI
ncbi:NAD(P)H-binding protein [Peredibacter starrii]|uniref:NAD(P)H-binding protein n=1 Tax=Peredibacter starrii TaxID=28202 RepID=A0AAX4HLG9_9BACT|nr:NAD(P)H-binding protein [Peredibacter starrii]WPU64108.1 NAD(P)H-binding protein [Peredibacter starrii]